MSFVTLLAVAGWVTSVVLWLALRASWDVQRRQRSLTDKLAKELGDVYGELHPLREWRDRVEVVLAGQAAVELRDMLADVPERGDAA